MMQKRVWQLDDKETHKAKPTFPVVSFSGIRNGRAHYYLRVGAGEEWWTLSESRALIAEIKAHIKRIENHIDTKLARAAEIEAGLKYG